MNHNSVGRASVQWGISANLIWLSQHFVKKIKFIVILNEAPRSEESL